MEDQELTQPRGGSLFWRNSPVRGCFASTMALVPSSDYGGIARAYPWRLRAVTRRQITGGHAIMTEAREVGASPSTSLKAEPGLLEQYGCGPIRFSGTNGHGLAFQISAAY